MNGFALLLEVMSLQRKIYFWRFQSPRIGLDCQLLEHAGRRGQTSYVRQEGSGGSSGRSGPGVPGDANGGWELRQRRGIDVKGSGFSGTPSRVQIWILCSATLGCLPAVLRNLFGRSWPARLKSGQIGKIAFFLADLR